MRNFFNNSLIILIFLCISCTRFNITGPNNKETEFFNEYFKTYVESYPKTGKVQYIYLFDTLDPKLTHLWDKLKNENWFNNLDKETTEALNDMFNLNKTGIFINYSQLKQIDGFEITTINTPYKEHYHITTLSPPGFSNDSSFICCIGRDRYGPCIDNCVDYYLLFIKKIKGKWIFQRSLDLSIYE
jgi:hypothetical protein